MHYLFLTTVWHVDFFCFTEFIRKTEKMEGERKWIS